MKVSCEVYCALACALPLLLPLFACVLFLLLGSWLFLHGSFYTLVFLWSLALKVCSEDSIFAVVTLYLVSFFMAFLFYDVTSWPKFLLFILQDPWLFPFSLFFLILLSLSTLFARCLFSSSLFPEESLLLLSQLPTVTVLHCYFHSLSFRTCKSNIVLPFHTWKKKSLFWTISKLTAHLPADFSMSELFPPPSPAVLTPQLLPHFGPQMCPSNLLPLLGSESSCRTPSHDG